MFVNVRRCICVDVVYNASYRACKICRCVFHMNCSETCECLSQTSFREFVVATVATPGTTADLHGSSMAHELGCPVRLSSFRRGRGTFLLSKLMFLVLLVRSEENTGDDSQSMVEIWILGSSQGATRLHPVTVMIVIGITATLQRLDLWRHTKGQQFGSMLAVRRWTV